MFTLEGCAAQAESPSRQHYGTLAGLPPEVANVTDALTCISSYFAVMLDSEPVRPNPVPGWERANQDFTAWLAGESRSSSQKRNSIKGLFLVDLKMEALQAAHESGITPEELAIWLDSYFEDDVRALGSLGFFYEIYQDKHLDPRTNWSFNDLMDMMELTCAAGYADFVVADRSFTGYARQAAKRLQRSINIYRRISDLIVAIKEEGL